MSNFVPNQFPAMEPGERRLAIIGECPGNDEENWHVCPAGHTFSTRRWQGGVLAPVHRCPQCGTLSTDCRPQPTPFVGPSGQLLDYTLARAGIRRAQCFVGNVSRINLPATDFCQARLQRDLNDLGDELARFRPNCVLLLGNQALRAFHPWHWTTVTERAPEKVKDPLQFTMPFMAELPRRAKSASRNNDPACKISDWRGSIFPGDLGLNFPSCKCVAAYHPAAVLRSPEWLAVFRFDVKRAISESDTTALNLPHRQPLVAENVDDMVSLLQQLRKDRRLLGFDLEGYPSSGITICSFATSEHAAVVVPFQHIDYQPWWPPAGMVRVLAAFKELLEDPEVPKTLHNALYELFVLRWHYGIRLQGITGDTMLKWHELYSELDKSLDVPASVLTRQPFWKCGMNAPTDKERIAYNVIDSCVTWELDQLMEPLMTPGQRQHYAFNLSLLEPMADQMFRGIRFDLQARADLAASIKAGVFDAQGKLDRAAGLGRPSLLTAAEVVCKAKTIERVKGWDDLVVHAKPTWLRPYE